MEGVLVHGVHREQLVFGDGADRVWGGHAAFLLVRWDGRQSITRPARLTGRAGRAFRAAPAGFRISWRADTVPPSWLCPAGPAPCSLPVPLRARRAAWYGISSSPATGGWRWASRWSAPSSAWRPSTSR